MKHLKAACLIGSRAALCSADSLVCCFADCQSARIWDGTKRRECKAYVLPPHAHAGWQPAIQQARQPALRMGRIARWLLSTPRASPAPLLRAGAQTCLHRVGPDIPPHPRLLLITPNPMIERFNLPERFPSPVKD